MRLILLILLLCTPAFACGNLSPSSRCKSNIKNLATALEMWSSDHGGQYPKRLDLLVPTYLQAIPQCPAASQDTYSINYQRQSQPDTFALCCTGPNHPELGAPNYPAYSAEFGLLDRCLERNPASACLVDLTRVGQALSRYQHDRGEYPDALDQLVPFYLDRLPQCKAGEFSYPGAQGVVSCPECAHLDQGLAYQQPQWTPARGVQMTRLKQLSARPPARNNQNVPLIFSLCLLIIAWSVLPARITRTSFVYKTAPLVEIR